MEADVVPELMAATAPGGAAFVELSWRLVYPSIIAAVLGVVLLAVLFTARTQIAARTDTPIGRVVLPSMTALLGLTSGACADVIDFSELIKGNAQPNLFWLGPFMIFPGIALLACLFFTWYRDHVIANLQRELQEQAEEARRGRETLEDEHAKERARLTRLKQAGDLRARQIRQLVGKKMKRVRDRTDGERQRLTSQLIRSALDPAEQLGIILGCLHACMIGNRELDAATSLRLALYVPSPAEDEMLHFLSTNGELEDQEGERIQEHREFFKLPCSSAAPCLVTYAATNGGLHVIRDSTDLSEDERQKFRLFYSGQEQTLRSAFAYAIEASGHRPYPVLMSHSSYVGGFSGPIYPEEILRKDVEAFGHRIAFELHMLQFLVGETQNVDADDQS